MPIYAFLCKQCAHQFDRLQRISDPDPDTCPACGAKAVQRELSAPHFRLAGSGWYETDFKSDNDKKRNLADSSATTTDTSVPAPSAEGVAASANTPAKPDPAASTS